MPRDGSPTLPPGAVPPAPMIGEAADPPFAVLPVPTTVFARRSERFSALAAEPGDLGPYLKFLSALTSAQHDVQEGLPQPALPAEALLLRARENAMPPLAIDHFELGETADRTLLGICERMLACDLSEASRGAAGKVLGMGPDARAAMLRAVLLDEVPEDRVAEHVLAAAALQVHMTRLAARLDADGLVKVADGACPVCGSAPVASAIVGWPGASGARFCTCSMCATQWHVVRITCLVCGGDKGVAYHSLEQHSPNILAETCEGCSSYVKILHQHKDPKLDPIADDVASLALDMVLGREGWMRSGVNPFLMGY